MLVFNLFYFILFFLKKLITTMAQGRSLMSGRSENLEMDADEVGMLLLDILLLSYKC